VATVDASIPLQVQQPNLMTPFQAYSQVSGLQAMQQQQQLRDLQIQQEQQTLRDQMQLSSIASKPENIDPTTGQLKPEALSQVQNPILRQRLNKERLESMWKKEEIDSRVTKDALEIDTARTKKLHDVMEQGYAMYDSTLQHTGDKAAATKAFQDSIQQGYEGLRTGGLFKQDTQFKIPTPEEVYAKLTTVKEREEAKSRAETPFQKDVTALQHMVDEGHGNSPEAHALRDRIRKETHVAEGTEGKPLTDVGKLNADLAAKRITQEQYDAEVGKKTEAGRDKKQADDLARWRAENPMMAAGNPTTAAKAQGEVTFKEFQEQHKTKEGKPANPVADAKSQMKAGKLTAEQLKSDAEKAIAAGKDSAAVKKRYKEITGKDY
jgi:hypothetical protein